MDGDGGAPRRVNWSCDRSAVDVVVNRRRFLARVNGSITEITGQVGANLPASGDYVAILAGPYQAEGVTWWRVQTAIGTVGWIPGDINGVDTIGP